MPVKTPVALIVFNRPDLTRLVVEAVRQAKPTTLLVVADGPRRPDEVACCEQVRAIVLDLVDWECDVRTNFADANLGCRERVSSGLDWVFDEVTEAIVLEDDCVPVPSFFTYCDALLARYRDDERVMHIGGYNALPDRQALTSYRFSRFTHVWGWATWRRAWQHYDVAMRGWPEFAQTRVLRSIGASRTEEAYYRVMLDRAHANQIDTWDYQWQFACWSQSGLATVPAVNLVKNIGFRDDGTHTHATNPLAGVPTEELPNLVHPRLIVPDMPKDRQTFRRMVSGGNVRQRVYNRAWLALWALMPHRWRR